MKLRRERIHEEKAHQADEKDVMKNAMREQKKLEREQTRRSRSQLKADKLDLSGGDPLPPREASHSAEREKWTQLFYKTLFFLFFCLMLSMIFWGYKHLSEL
jgi:predicted phage gp36 major capsid-like protein